MTDPRLKLSPDGTVYQRDYSAPSMPAWYVPDTEPVRTLTDAQVADWPDLVAAPDIDRMTAEIVAVANHDVAPLVASFLPALRVDYRNGSPGEWNVSVAIRPRGETPRFARAIGPSLFAALAELHAKVVPGEPRDL